jgi:hypothetical protein
LSWLYYIKWGGGGGGNIEPAALYINHIYSYIYSVDPEFLNMRNYCKVYLYTYLI